MENTPVKENLGHVEISKEMKDAYLQYSMSVIVGRALPDVRDGLKPVHRRVLFAMNELGNNHNKPYKKSARVVGDTIGKYHPHGDIAVYDTIVRMAQEFSLRYPLVDGQGNFGSIDGDSAAAMRYTEIRMKKLAEELLEDIEKDTVTFSPNYDDSLLIPNVLPAKFPNLLVNGSTGIAVGMATNIPPHNLKDICTAVINVINDPEVSDDDLISIVQAPDFPTHGVIVGKKGIIEAYKKGRGIITIKAVAEIITSKNDREHIIVTELPYQVNKARLIENMAALVNDKKIEGISDIRDESSREGIRIVIDVKKSEGANIVLNRLFKFTQMQVSFGIIMLALDAKGRPHVYRLKDMLTSFADHRRDVVTRRCIYELKKAEERAHILEGLTKALDQIDEVIKTIKASKEPNIARAALMSTFSFSERQAQAILEMRLQRLTGLERDKILAELKEIMARMNWLRMVLGSVAEINKIIIQELTDIIEKYGDERRTKIEASEDESIDDEDLITKEEMVVCLTKTGYIKRVPLNEYRVQKRGGRGLVGMETREEDVVTSIFVADTHTTLLVFTDRAKVFWVKVHKLPAGSRQFKGRAINNVVQLSADEKVTAILPVKEFKENQFLVFVTKKGIIKKTELSAYSRPKQNGIIALSTDLDDSLIGVSISNGENDIFLATRDGMCIRFDESNVRGMGRSARGVKGITLSDKDEVVDMSIFTKNSNETILVVTSKGIGKRVVVSEYRAQSRGGVGVITQKTDDAIGYVVGAKTVTDDSNLILTSNTGQLIQVECKDISTIGRNTKGVRIFNVRGDEQVVDMAVVHESKSDSEKH
jgi:DNA gyrase subunit A